jgi:hypothetical protein
MLLSIQECNSQLQNCGKTNPKKIWNIYESNPFEVWIDDNHRPDKSRENKENIQGGQIIILQAELNRGEEEIENQIENERQKNNHRQFFVEHFIKNCTERNKNNDIKHSPDRTEKPRWRSPGRLDKLRIP